MCDAASPSFVILLDEHLRVLKIPQGLSELLGLTGEDDDRRLDWRDLVTAETAKCSPLDGDGLTKFTGSLKKRNGEVLEAKFESELLAGAGSIIYVSVQISGEKSAGLRHLDRDTLAFLTTVSHELRVALNGVVGFADVLGSSKLDGEQRAVLDKLQSCNLMLKGLINDILEYSRVSTSKLNMDTEMVDLEEFMDDVVGLFRERARSKGLDLRLEFNSLAKPIVPLSSMRVTQVLSNLISNAIKFTSEGSVTVSVSSQPKQLCIGVRDTGKGVDAKVAESIFKPFFQVGDEAALPEGSGLGLAICKELVSKLGGTLELIRPEEGGCLFEMVVPLENVAEPDEGSLSQNSKCATSKNVSGYIKSIKDKKILVVEDNQLNADILGHFLSDYGVQFERVDNGFSAVEAFEQDDYDLVLMDVMLPKMSGYEATEKILRRSTSKPKVPVIGVTAKVFRRDQLRCFEAGMVEVVHKPVDFDQLRSVLNRFLNPEGGETSAQVQKIEEDSSNVSPLGDEGALDLFRGAEAQPLDEDTLEAYIERMESADTPRDEVISSAIEIVDLEVSKLVEAIEKEQRKEIGMLAHSLKGALSLLGARTVRDLANALELLAGNPNAPLKVEHWSLLIQGAYAVFKSELETYLSSAES